MAPPSRPSSRLLGRSRGLAGADLGAKAARDAAYAGRRRTVVGSARSGSSRAEVRRQNPPRTRLPWLGQRAGMVSARPHDGLRKRPHGDDAVAVALHERNVVRTRRGGAHGAPVLSGHVPEALANAGDVA